MRDPELAPYLEGWMLDSDLGVVAEQNGQNVGAAWLRIRKGEAAGSISPQRVREQELEHDSLIEDRSAGTQARTVQRNLGTPQAALPHMRLRQRANFCSRGKYLLRRRVMRGGTLFGLARS